MEVFPAPEGAVMISIFWYDEPMRKEKKEIGKMFKYLFFLTAENGEKCTQSSAGIMVHSAELCITPIYLRLKFKVFTKTKWNNACI